MAKSSGGGKKARRNGAPSPGDKMRWQAQDAGAAGAEGAEAAGRRTTATRENQDPARGDRNAKDSAHRPAAPKNMRKSR
ncbi:hypothetical protein GCM10010191_54100 [Actinomadura vinacea]|uniref:Plasmid stabilization protein n=1 Tax=Actinomadura vinacea TaxID=115336 RepID=A0ABP5WTY4_9ACTN